MLSLNSGPHKFSLEASFFLNLREGQVTPMIFSQTQFEVTYARSRTGSGIVFVR
jgi:hypothetical protein